MMMDVRLNTADGSLVGVATIPPFQTLPDVLTWGDRNFIPQQGCVTESPAKDEAGRIIYREAFAFYVATPVTDPYQGGTPGPANWANDEAQGGK